MYLVSGSGRGVAVDFELMKDIVRIEDGDALGIAWPGAEPHMYRPGDDRGAQLAFIKAVRDGVLRAETPNESTAREVARRVVQERVGITKDAGGDLIVAWWLPLELAQSLVIPGGVAAEDMHLTLLYLGDPSLYDLDLVTALVKVHASAHCYDGHVKGAIGGMGRFVGEGDQDVVVALVDSPGLTHLRRCLREDLYCYGAVPEGSPLNAEEHGFIPHVTLGYLTKQQASPPPYTETIPLSIDALTVAAGSQRVTFAMNEGGHDYPAAEMAMYASRATGLTKAGRVLSAASINQLKAAQDAIQALLARGAVGSEGTGDDDEGLGLDVDQAGGPGSDVVGKGNTAEVEYHIEKADGEKRYTLGPLYAPNRKDAHGDWVEADVLQEAVWDYVRMSSDEGRALRLQHGDGTIVVGEWVEVMAWPYEHTITITKAGEEPRELTMPAGTVYMGVQWSQEAWPLVKEGKLGGLSLGGRAIKVGTPDVTLDAMGDLGGGVR